MEDLIRIEKIVALLEAHPQGISGQELAEACNVPWTVMLKDLTKITLDEGHAIPLYNDEDAWDNEQSMGSNGKGDSSFDYDDEGEPEIVPQVKWRLQANSRRNSPLHFTVGELVQILECQDFFQEQESVSRSLKQKLCNHLDLQNAGKYRCIKGSMAPVERMDDSILLRVEKALREQYKISFEYDHHPVIADPLGLVYYSRLRQWYLVAQTGSVIKTYNLTKVYNLQELSNHFTYPVGFSIRDWLAPRWGMEFGDPVTVRVRFHNRSQTFAKVRKDVAHRRCRLSEEENGEVLVYEDTIMGQNEFMAWILGFGSAAEVVEPIDLRNRIVANVRETLVRYR